MITSHEKFKVPDEGKTHELIFEVNWNPHDKKSNNCQIVRVTMPNGDAVLIRKEHLNAILFAIGTEEEQQKMIPQTLTHSRIYETVVGVTAQKDIRKGEKVIFPIKLTLPTLEETVIGEIKDVRNKIAKGQLSA